MDERDYNNPFNDEQQKNQTDFSGNNQQQPFQPGFQENNQQQPYQNNYGSNYYPNSANNVSSEIPGHGYAVASLVLGILSFCCLGLIGSILAIVFGRVAKSRGNTEGMSTAGEVLGIVSLCLNIVAIVVYIIVFANGVNYYR